MLNKITYCITVADEEREFRKLYKTLRINKRDEDNIFVLLDLNKTPKGSEFYLELCDLVQDNVIKLITDKFDGHFGDWKNKLIEQADGDWLVFLDADERLPPQFIDDLPQILEMNPEVNIIGLPRQNFTKDITQEDCNKWGWTLDELGRNCWPDYQYRIMRSNQNIKWVGKIHETLIGSGITTKLPEEPAYAILHSKTIERQRKQNESYQTENYSK